MSMPTFADIHNLGDFKPAYSAVNLNVPKAEHIKLLTNRVQKFDNIIRIWVLQTVNHSISLPDVKDATILNIVTYDRQGNIDTTLSYKVKSNNQIDFDWDNNSMVQSYIYSFEIIG